MDDGPAFEPPVTRSWDFPRQVAGTALLVAEGVAAGATTETLLRGTGLGVRDLGELQREVTAEQELRVVRNLQRAVPGVSGAAVGARYHVSTFGPLGFALMSAPRLGDAANLALRYIDLSFALTIPSATVEERQEGSDVVIVIDDRDVPADVRRFVVERDLAAIWTLLREISGGGVRASMVELPFPAADVATHRGAWGLLPRWTAAGGRARLRFDAAFLEVALPQANPHAFALAEAMCRDLVSPRRSRHGVVEHVRILVAQRLAAGAPMGDVAAALGLSERSLRRRLDAAGTSYREVVDEVRRTAADDLLADGRRSVAEVASALGYAESTSFGAAYRRWHGRSPRGT